MKNVKNINKEYFQNLPTKIQRIAVFASFNKENIISEYVIYYLTELKKVVDAIIFVADNPTTEDELKKIENLVVYVSCYNHKGYDFGSYRIGYQWAIQNGLLHNVNELIFLNDSCYGPVFPFYEVFDTMQNVQTDLWGMTRSQEIKEHLQSYFLVFKRSVFLSHIFQNFVNCFERQEAQVKYIQEYELNFTEVLRTAGFTYTSYIDVQKYAEASNIIKDNPTKYPESLYRMHIPLIKKKSYLIDFSLQLKESIISVHKTLSTHNSELYNAINKDLKLYYTTNSNYKTKEWQNIALSLIEKEQFLDFATNTIEHNIEMLNKLQWKEVSRNQQKGSNNTWLQKIVNTIEQQASQLEQQASQLQELRQQLTTLTKNLHISQQLVEFQRKQLSHRSIRVCLKLEKKIDYFNKLFHLGKYNKNRQSILNTPIELGEEPMATLSYDSWYEENIDYSHLKTDIKAIALYLPQFHSFKENDEWWGKGFTEWTNTTKSRPRFLSHYQPREPHKDFGYYDLSDWRVLEQQARLAKEHGIYGFCFYRYWFSGKTLMEKPLDLLLSHPEIDINFCLCWANENWTRKWDGNNEDILIGQDYKNNSVEYIEDIRKYIEDPRYIRVNGKPVIIIYRPNLLPNASQTFKSWREWARHNGIGEILIWIQRGCASMEKSEFVEGADAEIEFPPSGTAEFDSYDITRAGANPETGNLIGYRKMVKNIIAGKGIVETFKHNVYRGITLGWDNSPRRKDNFWATWGFSLHDYYMWLKYIIEYTRNKHSQNDRFIFINAWNEWAEGTYLEPDKRFGYSSINVTARALFGLQLNPHIDGSLGITLDPNEKEKAENLISRGLPLFPYAMYAMYHDNIENNPIIAWEACNQLESPIEELRKLRKRFIYDNNKTKERLGLKRIFIEDMPLRSSDAEKKTIAIHIHLFYIDMTPSFVTYLQNIPFPFDLFVSIPQTINCEFSNIENKFAKVKNLKNITIMSCPNRGRDIAPLICTFGKYLLKYDYFAHFHSKKSLHTSSHNTWAEYIFSHLLGSENNISRIIRLLDSNIGVIAPPDFLMMPELPSGWGSNIKYAQHLLDKANVKVNLKQDFPVIEFPQGSMFWARTDYMKKLLTHPISYKDFPEEPIGTDGTIAHAFERLFYIWGIDKGMEIRQIFLPNEESCMNRQR